jgi:hypothetical protein
VLNVRRGDYTKAVNQQTLGLASAAYYARALRLLRRLGVSGPVFVVSDELDLAMAELADIPDLQPIAPPAGTDLIEIVLAMSRAHAMVMANSTFSWWAAWLGDRPDRPVIAPRPWFNTLRLSERDLLLPHWVSLEARDVTGEPGATDLAVAAGESA